MPHGFTDQEWKKLGVKSLSEIPPELLKFIKRRHNERIILSDDIAKENQEIEYFKLVSLNLPDYCEEE